MHFLNGFLVGYFWRTIVALIFVFTALGFIAHQTEQHPYPLNMIISIGGAFIALPVIVCVLHKFA